MILLRYLLALLAYAVAIPLLQAQTATRSDTLDVLHYAISLDLVALSPPLNGTTTLTIVPKLPNVSMIQLDLAANFTVSSVVYNGVSASFAQVGDLLRLPLSQSINPTDTITVSVSYSGTPPQASFGGFYYTSTYAYNLGVGIGVDPPTYGRSWFACVDNFVERSTFEYFITTSANRKAFCGGLLVGSTTNPNGTRTWHWQLGQQIPTYLASVAVSDYQTLSSTVQSIGGNTVPVQLAARAADTTNLKASFVHLPDAFAAFEQAWGAYRFDRVGYAVVPFGGGAMEHACNIAYPTFAVDGTLTWEHQLMAHEFAHHWFGDLVTCETAADMWLNEGWASYCESYFLEAVYGRSRYIDDMRKNNGEVMQYAHIRDGSHLAVAGVPFDATYGDHVYNKGASVAHALRAYMGDEHFFGCIRQYMTDYAFRNANSQQFRDYLSACSGTDLSHFFDDWVFSAGFANFTVDSTLVTLNADGSTLATVFARQRLYAAPHYYQQVPIDVTFWSADLQSHTVSMTITEGCSQAQFALPFYPVYTALDWNDRLTDATTDQHLLLTQAANYDFADEKMNITVNSIDDTVLLHIAHHWVMPDRLDTPNANLRLSPNRYWQVGGYQTGNFSASANFTYNGSNSTNGGYLDNQLIGNNENNLRLLYRTTSADDWAVLPASQYTINTQGNAADKRGTISLANNLQFGEYALAYANPSQTDTLQTAAVDCVTVGNWLPPYSPITVAAKWLPNPTSDTVMLQIPQLPNRATQLVVRDLLGRVVYTEPIVHTQTSINTKNWAKGAYIVALFQGENCVNSQQLVVK